MVALLAVLARVGVAPGPGLGSAGQSESARQVRGGGKFVPPAEQPAAETATPYEGPWLATRHFFAPYASLSSSVRVDLKNPADILGCLGDAPCLAQLRQLFGVRDDDRVECLLATVPDPYHTRLALFTDDAIDGIWKGAGATGWQFSTQWLPWNDTADSKEGDPAARAKQREEIREQEAQPGVLVFRRAEQQEVAALEASRAPAVLLVFVVGETPTAGVNPAQFQIARTYMRALSSPGAAAETVRIVGPTLSGSFDSLAELIVQDKLLRPGKLYQVRSGTATSVRAKEAFDLRAGSGVKVYGATENIRDQKSHFIALLRDLRIPNDRAAILAEGGSAFGRAAAEEGPEKDVRILRFPEDISHLRDSYRQAQQPSKSEQTPTPSLDFSLKDSTAGEDSVPTYSQIQSPLSQYGVIDEVIRAIRRDDIRIVEISATNVLDLLFLAGVLRQQCPDTRLLIASADLLFVQAGQTQPLDGMLFLTSYPLFAESKLWEKRKQVLIFPDTRSEGVFNAMVLSLDHESEHPELLADYAWQDIPHPPEWLLTLDHRGFLPVRFWKPDGVGKWFQPVAGLRSGPAPGGMPRSRLLNVISILFALSSVALCSWVIALGWKTDWVVDARFAPPKSENSWRGFFLFLFLVALAGIQIVIAVASPGGDGGRRLFILAAGGALPILIASYVAFRECRPSPWDSGWRARAVAMGFALAAVTAGILLWCFGCPAGDARCELFLYRAAEMRMGSSPLWPIVAPAAAVLLWCAVHITRIYFATCQEPPVMSDGGLLLQDRLAQSRQHFTESARSALGFFAPNQLHLFWVALAAALVLCGLFRIDVRLASIDGLPFDILCIGLQLLVVGLVLLTCWHIRTLSTSLHFFTTTLDMLPLAGSFVQASANSGNRPIWVRRYNLQSPDIAKDMVIVLHDMALLAEQLTKLGVNPARARRWCAIYRRQVSKMLALDHLGRNELGKRRDDLGRASVLLARRIWELILKPSWTFEPLLAASSTSAKAPEPAAEAKDKTQPARAGFSITGDPTQVVDLAETFVALHYSPFLLYAVRQIQNLLWFPCVGFVLLMFSMSSYNFQSPRLIGRLLLFVFVAVAWILGTCLAQMERDPVLSRISGSTPGDLSVGFYLKLARYGALPVFGMIAWQFPSISNFLLSWVEPTLEALK